jgi:DNA-binding CsgD family transcriptional regulator
MDQKRLARLTEQQRICLRYVYAHMTSKEIAPLMGIEPNSVDQHIKTAMRVLDVGDRRTAARMLAEHEQPLRAQPLVYQPLDVAFPPDQVTFAPPSGSGGQQGGFSGETLRENQAAFSTMPAPWIREFHPPLPIWGGRPNDLNWAHRLGWIFGIMLLIALAFGVFVAGFEALSRLGRTISF